MNIDLEKIFEVYKNVNLVLVDGFDDAILGVDEESHRVIYSIDKCLQILLEKGADPNLANIGSGYTAINFAIIKNDINIVKLLLEKGANINLTEKQEEKTPIFHLLDIDNAEELLDILIEFCSPWMNFYH